MEIRKPFKKNYPQHTDRDLNPYLPITTNSIQHESDALDHATTDEVGSTEDAKSAADSSKLAVKKPRPKASSPNRQGPQQCQVSFSVRLIELFS
uniref:Uncharacterized protein n=1 Tax=Timema cristinae TaxID=61476 RepID=A0A7R9CDR0_TIMCR|nr:unnamed protein product [Timema cristinae]